MLFADAGSVAHAGADALHLTDDSHQPLAELVADVVRSTAGARLGDGG